MTSSSVTSLPTNPIEPVNSNYVCKGTTDYIKARLALFLLGFANFSLIYCIQPLLPQLSSTFQVSATESSLALSLTTGFLAFAIVLAGAFSQTLGRRGLMFVSLALAAILNIAVSLTPSWHGLLIARALEGIVIGGVPAVAMAWLAEEIEPAHLGEAMGLYVAGTAFGGMMGRVGMGILTEFTSWRHAMGILGVLCLFAAIGFIRLLPPSRNFVRQTGFNFRYHLQSWAEHLRNPTLLKLYGLAFLLTGAFVSVFNFSTFRLTGAPYSLSQTVTSLIFLAYGFGIVSSSIAGTLADRYGKRPLLLAGLALLFIGTAITVVDNLMVIVIGIALLTTGFFITHSVASASVGSAASQNKGHATSLYLLAYYVGSSIIGSASGWFWENGGWTQLTLFTSLLSIAAIILAMQIRIKKSTH